MDDGIPLLVVGGPDDGGAGRALVARGVDGAQAVAVLAAGHVEVLVGHDHGGHVEQGLDVVTVLPVQDEPGHIRR